MLSTLHSALHHQVCISTDTCFRFIVSIVEILYVYPCSFVTFQSNYPYQVKMTNTPASVRNDTIIGSKEPIVISVGEG